MKIAIHIIILIFLAQSCNSQEKDFKISYESFDINIPGQPGPWLKKNEKFYCYFLTDNDRFSSGSDHTFYIINKNGEIESEILVPDELQTFYYDLYIKNDTIFTTEYYDQNTFYLDEVSKKWVSTEKGNDLFYEDNDYQIFSLDFGEWGGVTWFKNKQNQKQSEVAASSPIINKLNNYYYITLNDKILEIKNPNLLEISKEPYDYNKAVLQENYFREGSHSLQGVNTIFEYKDDDYFNPKFSITTSFISNNKLLNVYKDSISTKIGIVENHKLIPIYEFKDKIIPLKYNYDWRQQVQNNNFQSFQFRTEKRNNYGIVDIQNNKILVTTFNNKYEEIILSKTEMQNWLEKYLDYYLKNFDNLKVSDIVSIETSVSATNLTQRHKISHYLVDGKNIETPKIFRKQEDNKFKLVTSYYYSTNDNLIQLINFDWAEIKTEDDFFSTSSLDMKTTIYKSKYEEILKIILKLYGKPNKSNKEDLEWYVDDKVIKLDYNLNQVELTIYKK